jgi:D-glycero-beta-D-manno-heptose-7-phosphate kinase
MNNDKIKNILNNFAGKKVAVIGDLMLDVYIWGKVSRISPEAPVPVVHVKKKTYCLGGAANVMRNIVSLSGEAIAFGIIGTGTNGKQLLNLMEEENINTDYIIVDNKYTTIEKQRIIADSQQLARVDYEDKDIISTSQKNSITKALLSGIDAGNIEGIIFEDYAKGLLDSEMINKVISSAKKKNIPVALDPHPSHKMDINGLTLMTPNHIEAFGLAGIYLKEFTDPINRDPSLKKVAKIINTEFKIKQLLITLGAKGMLLFEDEKPAVHIPTKAKEVFDVTGAGDTVIAVNLLAILGGATGEEAAHISNHAAGIVVGRIGTSSVTKEEILEKNNAN